MKTVAAASVVVALLLVCVAWQPALGVRGSLRSLQKQSHLLRTGQHTTPARAALSILKAVFHKTCNKKSSNSAHQPSNSDTKGFLELSARAGKPTDFKIDGITISAQVFEKCVKILAHNGENQQPSVTLTPEERTDTEKLIELLNKHGQQLTQGAQTFQEFGLRNNVPSNDNHQVCPLVAATKMAFKPGSETCANSDALSEFPSTGGATEFEDFWKNFDMQTEHTDNTEEKAAQPTKPTSNEPKKSAEEEEVRSAATLFAMMAQHQEVVKKLNKFIGHQQTTPTENQENPPIENQHTTSTENHPASSNTKFLELSPSRLELIDPTSWTSRTSATALVETESSMKQEHHKLIVAFITGMIFLAVLQHGAGLAQETLDQFAQQLADWILGDFNWPEMGCNHDHKP